MSEYMRTANTTNRISRLAKHMAEGLEEVKMTD